MKRRKEKGREERGKEGSFRNEGETEDKGNEGEEDG